MLVAVETLAPFNFQKRLKELRLACRWTQEKAAESCGLGYKLYQLYELGIKANPGLRTLGKIANGFGLELHELFAPEPLARLRSRSVPAKRGQTTFRKRRKPN